MAFSNHARVNWEDLCRVDKDRLQRAIYKINPPTKEAMLYYLEESIKSNIITAKDVLMVFAKCKETKDER